MSETDDPRSTKLIMGPCYHCQGSGQYNDKQCFRCEGKGRALRIRSEIEPTGGLKWGSLEWHEEMNRRERKAFINGTGNDPKLQWDYDPCGSKQNYEWGE